MASRAPASLESLRGQVRARAWMLDAVFDLNLHPHLVNTNNGDIEHEYVRKVFHECDLYCSKTLNTMRGLDLISFSAPKHSSSLLNKLAVPVVAILHGTHELSLNIVQAMFGRIQGFWSLWTPIDFGPGTLYKSLEDHAMFKAFLDSSSTSLTDPVSLIRVDYKGNSANKQATKKNAERSRIWKFDGTIDSVLQTGSGIVYQQQDLFHDYLRQRIISETRLGNSRPMNGTLYHIQCKRIVQARCRLQCRLLLVRLSHKGWH